MHIPGSCGVEGTFFFLLCGTAAGLDQFTLYNLKTHARTYTHFYTMMVWGLGMVTE